MGALWGRSGLIRPGRDRQPLFSKDFGAGAAVLTIERRHSGVCVELRLVDEPTTYNPGPALQFCSSSRFSAVFDVDLEALDFLIEGREGNPEPLGGLGLAPVGTGEHFEDGAPLVAFHNLEE